VPDSHRRQVESHLFPLEKRQRRHGQRRINPRYLARYGKLLPYLYSPHGGRESWVDLVMEVKVCTKCGNEKPTEEFYWKNKEKGTRHSRCIPCFLQVNNDLREKNGSTWSKNRRDKYAANAEIRKKTIARNRENLYGITDDEYNRIGVEQAGVCATCKKIRRWRGTESLHVDHCHETGRVRGLLCYYCNAALGLIGDDIQTLQAMIEYLEKAMEEEAAGLI
jgi:hypothetical protein